MEDTLQAINKAHQKQNTDCMHEDINTKESNTRREHNILQYEISPWAKEDETASVMGKPNARQRSRPPLGCAQDPLDQEPGCQ